MRSDAIQDVVVLLAMPEAPASRLHMLQLATPVLPVRDVVNHIERVVSVDGSQKQALRTS